MTKHQYPELGADYLEPIKILDYESAGRQVVRWAQGKDPLPGTMAEFREKLAGIVHVPERYLSISFTQGDDHHFVMRLPPKNQVSQSEIIVNAQPKGIASYDPPKFYLDMLTADENFDNIPFFYSRIADYTIRGCR
jgi:hypothetical protein